MRDGTTEPIPVIDVFAGPGGLGEGFSAYRYDDTHPFKIRLSVEKDKYAHSTLELRSFFRQFPDNDKPADYYSFLRGEISRDELFSRHKKQASAAANEALQAELGLSEDNARIDALIEESLAGTDRWVLIGGPPCQAYSIIGRARRSRDAADSAYLPEDDVRSFLYLEYLRIIARYRPAVFVMENVKGMLSSTIQGQRIFEHIISDLRTPSNVFPEYSGSATQEYTVYSLVKRANKIGSGTADELKPEDFIVECEKYGIPQTRHRVILLGIRNDLSHVCPDILEPCDDVTIDDVISEMPKLRSGLSREADSAEAWQQAITDALDRRWLRGVRKKWGDELFEELIETIIDLTLPANDRGSEYVRGSAPVINDLNWWYSDYMLGGVCNHSARGHITKDVYRYLFAACFARYFEKSPKLRDFPPDLLPDHTNAKSGHFDDRFRVQVKGRPSTTITSHISKDGHYYIHYDPSQARSLTVREAARLQTFPDNYFFCGNRTQQYTQVGNAVPPLLAYKIAEIVNRIIKQVF
ncbi:DNA cytosine methyltransferase [Geobacter sulfurreducens]|uniref:DNA cytosine methyltransferase n=1 Tax=Geobacter sulfurreducens TaxID=35554 RepID=UPI0025744BCB|nr:DNA cytosine methyltransferase [Geobacter sulfurreducens]